MVAHAPRLLIVADHAYAGDDARWLAALRASAEAAQGAPVAVQVRVKDADGDALIRLATLAREAIPLDVPALLNGDATLAARLGYEGVHWPEDATPTPPATEPSDGLHLHSAAVHSLDALRRAEAAGADFVVFGAVFAPGSKPGEGVGIEALRAITAHARIPALAIGGITPNRVADCIQAGAAGIAVVSGILGAASPGDAVHAYLAALEACAAPARAPDGLAASPPGR